jgi:hypothetical protein
MNLPIFISASRVRSEIERLKLLFPEMAEDAELLADTLEGETEFHEVMTRLVRQFRGIQTMANAIGEEEEALASRRQRYERHAGAARKLMMSLMEAADVRKLELPVATVSIAAGRQSCVVTDEAALPEQFIKVERTPKKADITKALLAGEDIPGASLSNAAPHLTVRV